MYMMLLPMFDLAKNLIYVCKAITQCNSIEFFHDYCIIKTKFKNGKKNIIEIQTNWEFLLT